jgi:hypothetical protein
MLNLRLSFIEHVVPDRIALGSDLYHKHDSKYSNMKSLLPEL